MQIGKTSFHIGSQTYIVGILNVTPDSFSDGGLYNDAQKAVNRAVQMVAEGADIIEIGGESTRPGAVPVEPEVELSRVLPIVEAVSKAVNVPISVDTYKPLVAEAVLKSGVGMINDVFTFTRDPELARICAKYDATCCIMHNRVGGVYETLLPDMMSDLMKGVEACLNAGVKNIIIDPGLGFGKNFEQNLVILRNISFFTSYEYPAMLGASRKSFLGKILDLPENERLEGTITTTVTGIEQGVSFIRVHDVKENKRAALVADALFRGTQ